MNKYTRNILFTFKLFLISLVISSCADFTTLHELDQVSQKKRELTISNIKVSGRVAPREKIFLSAEEKSKIEKDSNYCSNLKNVVYEKNLVCDAYQIFSKRIEAEASNSLDIRLEAYVDSGFPRLIWSWVSYLSFATIPYWHTNHYRIVGKLIDKEGNIIEEYKYYNDILHLRFFPLVFYMPFDDTSGPRLYWSVHKNLLKKLDSEI